MKGIIVEILWPSQSSFLRTNQTANKYGMTRVNMSKVTNEGVMMCCKAVAANLLTVAGLLVEPTTYIVPS